MTSIVGRLAPSPTGHLHLGHARSFLLAYWHAKSRGGRLVLRIEDVDVARADPAHIDGARRDLEWLGIEWDGTARVQSARIAEMQRTAEDLAERGHAYACVCTRGDLRAQGAPQGNTGEVRYPGTCRGRFRSRADASERTSVDPGLRFAVPDGEVEFLDHNYGQKRVDVAAEVGDFLILRRNGMPSYQLAVVLDDEHDSVTEVVRGADLLHSTARQILLQRALNLPSPSYHHVSLVCDHSGRRLAKREADLGLSQLREAGLDPRVIVGWAAATSDQTGPDASAGEIPQLRASELLSSFDMHRVRREPVLLPPDPLAMLAEGRFTKS